MANAFAFALIHLTYLEMDKYIKRNQYYLTIEMIISIFSAFFAWKNIQFDVIKR